MAQGTVAKPSGLEGMIAGVTSICQVLQDDLLLRGYSMVDLAEHATFEDVAWLLFSGNRASDEEMTSFRTTLIAERDLPGPVGAFLDGSGALVAGGSAEPMDLLRTAVSMLGNLDPEAQDNSADAEMRKSVRLMAKMPHVLGRMQASIDGAAAPDANDGMDAGDDLAGHAANLFFQVTRRRPTADETRVMDVSLTLYSEHDFNASTFAARVIAATTSDLHSAVVGAIGALKGKLHGGANEAAIEMMRDVRAHVDAGGTVRSFMDQAFKEKRKLMGFGHRVYKHGDHRAPILEKLGKAAATGEERRLFELGDEVIEIMRTEKNIHPNVDFPCGMTYSALGISPSQYTPIFAASRVTGWCAHVMEQHANNRLIRPMSEYHGAGPRSWAAGG
ncbi:MAG: citrate/2-methylcitrate synthase [Planctomycetota bacterium]